MSIKHRNRTKYLKLYRRNFFALIANSCMKTILRTRAPKSIANALLFGHSFIKSFLISFPPLQLNIIFNQTPAKLSVLLIMKKFCMLLELDDGAYNPLWTMRGFTQTFHFWKENKRAQSVPLNAFLTYITLPWWSIAKGKFLLNRRKERRKKIIKTQLFRIYDNVSCHLFILFNLLD